MQASNPVPDASSANIAANAIPLAEIDVSKHELFDTLRVLPLFARLRREAPVHYCAHSRYGPYWSLTRHADIMAVDKDHLRFSSAQEHGGVGIDDTLTRPQTNGIDVPAFIAMDPPKHTRYRHAVQPLAGTPSLARMQQIMEQRTRDVLDALPRDAEFDWVEQVSIAITIQMLATLFAVPAEDLPKLRRWSDAMSSPEGSEGFVSHEHRAAQLMECLAYFTAVRERCANEPPRLEVISMLAHDPATRDMSPLDFLGQVILLIVGGNDTTRQSMSGLVNAINQFPDEWRKVRGNPALIDNLVQEVIRWQSPVPHMRRTAVEDVRIGEGLIRKGDKVVMWYYSGNRDESVFPDGDAIRVERENLDRHLAFGFGIHRCMGLRIAELQLRILIREVLQRFAMVELVRPPVRLRSNMANGYTQMMVRLRA
jgi:cytochrome P450